MRRSSPPFTCTWDGSPAAEAFGWETLAFELLREWELEAKLPLVDRRSRGCCRHQQGT